MLRVFGCEAFELSKFSKLPAEVRASYEAEDREYDRYSQHTAEQISKGEKCAKLEVAQNMLKRGRDLSEIVEGTVLSPQDVMGLTSTAADLGVHGRIEKPRTRRKKATTGVASA